jgi:dTDP-4-dehydrorhamnose 3,5-epimerase-like enzyme
VEVCGDAKASSSVAQGSAARFKAEIDEALLNELNKGKLVELNSELLSWEPHPELAGYHISFLKNNLSLIVHFQNHKTSWVSEKIDKSLFNWIHNQKTYLKWYKLGVSEEQKGKFHVDDRYVRYLRKLGVDVVLKVEDWIHNQKTYLKWYKLGVSEEKKGKFHVDVRYVRYIRNLRVDVVLKVEGDAEEE